MRSQRSQLIVIVWATMSTPPLSGPASQRRQPLGVGDAPGTRCGRRCSHVAAEDRLGDLLEHVDVEALDLRR